MEWRKSVKGNDILTIGTGDDYLCFGRDADIKWVSLSYVDGRGVRRGKTFGVGFTSVPKEVKGVIGVDRIAVLKEAFKTRIQDGVLKRDKFVEFASTLTAE